MTALRVTSAAGSVGRLCCELSSTEFGSDTAAVAAVDGASAEPAVDVAAAGDVTVVF